MQAECAASAPGREERGHGEMARPTGTVERCAKDAPFVHAVEVDAAL